MGLAIAILLQLFYLPQFKLDEKPIRVLGWLFLGGIVGLIEGLVWPFFSTSAGDKKRYRKRLRMSLFFAIIASSAAAIIFEVVRGLSNQVTDLFQQIEDPLGFCILGSLLGGALTFTTSPSFHTALRAGKGFEYRDYQQDPNDPPEPIDNYVPDKILKKGFNILWVKPDNQSMLIPFPKNRIKEGKTIKLGGSEPRKQNGQQIGSDIYIEGLPLYIGHFLVTNEGTEFFPKKDMFHQFEIKGISLTSAASVSVKHNDLIVFENNNQKYRFVYYDYEGSIPVISGKAKENLDLRFVSDEYGNRIEEGLSIELPEKSSIKITIGGIDFKKISNDEIIGSDIYLPDTEPYLGEIVVTKQDATLIPNPKSSGNIQIQRNGNPIPVKREISLKHNTLITFITNETDDYQPKMYRFVYYNRFLDPDA
ncbi:MAG: hypothetical protein GPJ25_01395 [Microcystis aeruginosa LE13-04]|nr:hypothetical protein [Microcystis aeruginosa LE13-04]